MPTLLLLDVSLSMLRNMIVSDKEISRKRVAIDGLSYLIEKFAFFKLDFVALAFFAEDAEIVVDFTKDYASLIDTLKHKCDLRTKTDYQKAFALAISHCLTSWGGNSVCHCVVVTDFSEGIRNHNSATTAITVELEEALKNSNIKFHICLLAQQPKSDDIVDNNLFKNIVSKNKAGGDVYYMDTLTTEKALPVPKYSTDASVQLKSNIDRIYDVHLAPMKTKLKCGTLVSQIFVHPKIEVYHDVRDFETIERRFSEDEINIFGFMKPADLANPPILSKHLILAASSSSIKSENMDPSRSRGHHDEEKIPNLCVLLHGSIVIDDSVAICHLGMDWFGYIYFWSVGKRSNLVLHCFQPGFDSVPWLGNFNRLAIRPYGLQTHTPKTPLSKTKPSYATTNPSWVQSYGLQSDLQKLIRYMKKLPEKEAAFYQELNRITNHAMSLGCVDLLLYFLDKEKSNSSSSSLQFKHLNYITKVISQGKLKFGEPIVPM